jgi:CDP-diacylglycerol--serine O-phosphatidyltransferase
MNLLSGSVAVIFAVKGRIELAAIFVFIGALMDFLDGTVARMLKVNNPIGKDLDSLADVVTFGLAPSVMIYELLSGFWAYCALLLVLFAALRLAKFNNDQEQKFIFKGLPTPAMALFFVAYVLAVKLQKVTWLENDWLIISLVLVFSILMVSNLKMMSLKFRNLFDLKENLWRYVFLLVSLCLIFWLKFLGIAVAVVCYVLLSVLIQPGK